jgi:hypothetical protein
VESSLFPGLVGIAIMAIGIRGLYLGRGSAHWPAVRGTVAEVEIEALRHGLDSNSRTVHYLPVLHYKYVVNGRLYRGKRSLGSAVTIRSNAVDLGRNYIPGHPIDVFVDEGDPQRHTLVPGQHRLFWGVIAFGLVFVGLALKLALE